MASVYSDYSRDRIGWFFGLSGPQVVTLAAGLFPALWAFNEQRWGLLLGLVAGWAALFVLVVVPVRGRSATGWLAASTGHLVGRALGWTAWRSHASRGEADDLAVPDLPGVLHGIRVHDGPPQPPTMTRVAVIQDRANRVWAVTAAITHPGLALADGDDRDRQGRGLTDLLNAAARTELISEVIFVVRSVPDDGAERDQWLTRHLRPDAPGLARAVNEQLAQVLSQAAVRTETYVTIVAPEARLAKQAKEFGRGVDARARAMLMLAGEVETHLRAGLRVTDVEWLTSPKLAAAVRTGFAPGDRAGIVEALAARDPDPAINADVPWAQAGPSGADQGVRH
ncbi:MAG: SCO6880 family protein, partial [Propionicimonas sp.]|nr:SCO6880 family protein [Propionicimonas sp.]